MVAVPVKGLLHACCRNFGGKSRLTPFVGESDRELARSGSTSGASFFFFFLEVQPEGFIAVKAWCAPKDRPTEGKRSLSSSFRCFAITYSPAAVHALKCRGDAQWGFFGGRGLVCIFWLNKNSFYPSWRLWIVIRVSLFFYRALCCNSCRIWMYQGKMVQYKGVVVGRLHVKNLSAVHEHVHFFGINILCIPGASTECLRHTRAQ